MVAPHVKPGIDPRVSLQNAIRESDDRVEKSFLEYLIDEYDWDTYREIQERHLSRKLSRWRSRLDVANYALKAFRMAKKLSVDQSRGWRILDIGCGPSHFALLARFWDHDVIGLDVPGDALFDDLNQFFETPRILHKIEPMQQLPDAVGPFDLVCAISANFNQKNDSELFDLNEWKFFLTDVASNQCKPDGQIQIILNKSATFSGLKFNDDQFVELIESHGGRICGQHIVFLDLAALGEGN